MSFHVIEITEILTHDGENEKRYFESIFGSFVKLNIRL